MRVVVTAMSALSCLGDGVDALWSGVSTGRSGISSVARFADIGLAVTTGGDVPSVPQSTAERDTAMGLRVIDPALEQAQLAADSAAFCWANGLDMFLREGDGAVHRPAGRCFASLARRFGRPRRMFAVACASGTRAIGEAYRLIREGHIFSAIAGGSSVMLSPFHLTGFSAIGASALDSDDDPIACRPFDRMRRGFALADGAAALVLESMDAALARGARPIAEIIGFGASQDAFDLSRPPANGAGAELAMRRSLADAGLTTVDAINAHGTGTVAGDIAEAAAIRSVLGERWATTPVSSIKGAIGHAMAAAGALEAVVAIETCRTGIVPPTYGLKNPDESCWLDHVLETSRNIDARVVLTNSFGMGGQNASLIVSRATP